MLEINPEHIGALIKILNKSPYFSLLGMRLKELRNNYAALEMELDPDKHMNPFGSVHGGALASVLDTAAYWAVYCGMDGSNGYTTIDLSVNNLAMAQSGRVIASANVIKQGRSICVCEAEAKDEKGRVLAVAVSKMMVLPNKQSVEELIKAEGIKLPPKYLYM